ncbi:MAG: hypothetical protein O7D32_07360, partial [bacterium]|nr:hypothetical protein [bacterium]
MVRYRKDILALVALGAVFAAAVVYARRVYAPCDDTYIYLVYAKNFLAGNGLTYNGIKIQGFTSTLWMLILLLGGVFPARLPVVAETLSAVSGLFVMVGAYWVSRRFGLSQIHALVVPVLLAGTWDFVFYMGNGMETVFLSGMILVVIGTIVTAPRGEPSRTRLVLVPLLLGLLALSRPECAIIVALIIAYLVWERRYREAIFGSGGALVFAGTAVIICRVVYRSWLPNTFHAKTGFGLENIPQGWAYLTQFVRPEIIILVPFVALVVGIIPRDRRALLMVAVIIAWIAQVVIRGGDNLVGFRAFLPVIPLVYMVIAVGARRVAGPAVLVAAVLITTIHVVNYRKMDIVASSWQIPMSQHAERWRNSFDGR